MSRSGRIATKLHHIQLDADTIISKRINRINDRHVMKKSDMACFQIADAVR
jgi:hypothetical protein